jgi:uncharacterized coiled-coil DUF342 family protein
MEKIEEKIDDLNRERSALKEKLDKLNSEARNWAEKRDAIHERIKKLRTEDGDLKGKRDALNEKVRELKGLRDTARNARKEKRVKILGLREELRANAKNKPPRSIREIQEKIESLEWKIQTTPLAFREEKALIDQVKPLGAQLLVYKRIQKLKDDIFMLQKESEALESEAKLCHEKLSELAEQSQAFHIMRIKALNQIRALKVEADIAHQKYVWIKEQAQDLRQKYLELSRQIESLEQKLRQAEEEKRAERQTELLKELEDKAREKLKHGEKLTLEEFKVLAEKGVL